MIQRKRGHSGTKSGSGHWRGEGNRRGLISGSEDRTIRLWNLGEDSEKSRSEILPGAIGGIAFGLLALSLPLEGFLRYSLAMFVIIAFNSATHDIAADGVYINTLSPKEQAQYVDS